MSNLFDSASQNDHDRLEKAGWLPLCEFNGHVVWKSPDGKNRLTEREALARLDKEEEEGP